MPEGETKTALVTGGARRIGAEICRRLHADGFNVAVHHRGSATEARALADELNRTREGSAEPLPCDLRETARLKDLVETCVTRFRGLDVLINNASTFYPTPLEQVDESQWDDLVGVNLKAPLFLARAAAPHLAASRGCIVNITDIHAERPMDGHSVYSIAKAGLDMLTRALAIELGPAIRVNGVAPGAILWPETGTEDAERRRVISRTALQRTGSPDEVARAVSFLVRDATYTTGQILIVDGGRSLRY
ncbi:MAG: pteridine reductase [Gammaproteobacteria bacterium]|nr:pteridine reductase [Gammaproteobacteria bacterium]